MTSENNLPDIHSIEDLTLRANYARITDRVIMMIAPKEILYFKIREDSGYFSIYKTIAERAGCSGRYFIYDSGKFSLKNEGAYDFN